MIKREFKINFKSFLIWTSILIAMFLVVFIIYPYMITDETMKQMDDMMKMFPPEMLKAFNMDMESISTAYGWLKTEGFVYVLLIIGIYASMLGINIVLKEESDKTIEYLSFVPIKRSKIMTSKIIVALIYIVLIVLALGIFNYIALLLSGDFDQKQFFLLSLTPLIIAFPLFAINLFISTFMQKTKKTVGISLGLVFLFYILSVLAELSDKVEFLKYFTVYTLADTRNVISKVEINPTFVIISLIITIIFITGSYIRYNKKELI